MSAITNVFVVMLENRSFDHLLGFSGITGTDAVTGQPTQINGLTGSESNSYKDTLCPVEETETLEVCYDPGHEFPDVVRQLCGDDARYTAGTQYPSPINNSGFVADWVASCEPKGTPGGEEGLPEDAPQSQWCDIMQCLSPSKVPVLATLAQNFAVCDNWFSSMPGPTWPNRFFACAGSSGGLDHSPTGSEITIWELLTKFRFPNGSMYSAWSERQPPAGEEAFSWRIYSDSALLTPISMAVEGVYEFYLYSNFAADVSNSNYPYLFTFIEPNYGDVFATYKGGNSQHPLSGVQLGEKFLKSTYEVIRSSPHWDTSLLIITWDEHGGFYDHVAPPAAPSPGDNPGSQWSQYGFTFEQYGVRVPAVIVSPLIPRNIVDHRLYDHSSILATIEHLYALPHLTERDRQANGVDALLTLTSPRSDAPVTLPDPASEDDPCPKERTIDTAGAESLEGANLPGFLHAALMADLEYSPQAEHPAIKARFRTIKTRAQADEYLKEVSGKFQAAKGMGH